MKLNIKEICLFGMLGAMMFASKLITEVLPNIHIICILIVAITAVYRFKALLAIYTFVIISGVFYAFPLWWFPYLYIWLFPWILTMLVPKKAPAAATIIIYSAVCFLHGILYGTLYAPYQALMFGLDFDGTIAWILAGIPFDVTHAISNLCCSVLIFPLIKALKSANKIL